MICYFNPKNKNEDIFLFFCDVLSLYNQPAPYVLAKIYVYYLWHKQLF